MREEEVMFPEAQSCSVALDWHKDWQYRYSGQVLLGREAGVWIRLTTGTTFSKGVAGVARQKERACPQDTVTFSFRGAQGPLGQGHSICEHRAESAGMTALGPSFAC